MRWLNLPFFIAMFGFAAVQYNDPDALLWIVYYLVPAARRCGRHSASSPQAAGTR
jgi:Transmembrane family 220, helix